MARSYVFLIHGIGEKKADEWFKPWKESIIAELQRYRPYGGMTAAEIESDLICFVPVSYDSVFEGYRTRWANLAGAIGSTDAIGNEALRKGLQWVADNGAAEGLEQFFWTSALDVLLWYGVEQARAAVVAKVNSQIADGIVNMLNENDSMDNAHFVAHSMGTSVVHDSLVSLELADEIHAGAFDLDKFKWQSIFMVSNTSRLLQTRFDLTGDGSSTDKYKAYLSSLKPGDAGSICRSYFNVRHRADPVSWPRMFDPAGWPSAFQTIETVRYDEIKEIHNFTTYIANPNVHLTMLRKLLGNNSIGAPDEISVVVDEFEREHQKHAGSEFTRLRDVINGDFNKELSSRELTEYFTRFAKEVA